MQCNAMRCDAEIYSYRVSRVVADHAPDLDSPVIPTRSEHALALAALTDTPVDRVDVAHAVRVSDRRDGLDCHGIGRCDVRLGQLPDDDLGVSAGGREEPQAAQLGRDAALRP